MNQITLLPQYQAAQRLEFFLGDPKDHSSLFSYQNSIRLDEKDEYPALPCTMLDEWGLNLYYFPESDGGKLKTFEEVLALARIVSRRDLSVTIDHSISFLGFVFLWIAASPQLRSAAAGVINKGGRVALGLTEKEHSDLLSTELQATRKGQHYILSGEKWLINNATRGEAITLLARTEPAGGFRGFSMFFVRKCDLALSSFLNTEKILTHGIRGVDVSGISFHAAKLATQSIVGSEGMGLEITMKGLQVTRTLCANLALGALDTALRIVVDFAARRKIYRTTVLAIPWAQTEVVNAFLDLLICDCISTAATRALHAIPEQMSVVSAVVKFFVPVCCERAVHSLASILGARHYLREGHWDGAFQKIIRDIAIVPLFDGNTLVNLNVISSQLAALASRESFLEEHDRENLNQIFDLSRPLPQFDPNRLRLSNLGKEPATQAIPHFSSLLGSAQAELNIDPGVYHGLQSELLRLDDEYQAFRKVVVESVDAARDQGQTAEQYSLAERYCLFHAAAACFLLWFNNREILGSFFGRAKWLVVALQKIIQQIRHQRYFLPASMLPELLAELQQRYYDETLFSVVPLRCCTESHQSRETKGSTLSGMRRYSSAG